MNEPATGSAIQIRQRLRWSPAAVVAALAFAAVVLGAPSPATARGIYMPMIPNGEEFGCDTCHTQLPWLTPFGIEVGRTHPRGQVDWQKLYFLDTDGDGQTNGFELGDPCGDWVIDGPDPARVERLSHPGYADSMVSPKIPVPDCPEPGDDDDSAEPPVVEGCGYSLAAADAPARAPGLLLVLALASGLALRRGRRTSLRTAAALGAFVAIAAVGCGNPYPASDGDLEGYFPHDEDWVLGGHWEGGRESKETCLLCHEELAEEEVDYTDEPPPCNVCHSWPLPPRPASDDEE